MQVKDIMSAPVIGVGPETPIEKAAEIMLRENVSGIDYRYRQ